MENNKKSRGKELNEKLKITLEEMIKDGYHLSPITISKVQKRLGLKSRSTLHLNDRSEWIQNARNLQIKNAGLTNTGSKKRKNTEEKLLSFKEELERYKTENKNLHKTLLAIMYNLDSRGLNVEEIMEPLR